MKDCRSARTADALTIDLQDFTDICKEALSLARCEHQALAGQADYNQMAFYERRKRLLTDIEVMLPIFRGHRTAWQQVPKAEREQYRDLKGLFQNIQDLLMRVMLLDRENQQAMLKGGMVPANHVPPAAAQRPHFVADLYKRNSSG
jgi:hypothetical protein